MSSYDSLELSVISSWFLAKQKMHYFLFISLQENRT
ncbi:hypothetical protein EVA_02039 [gut metagenome]|uniref:Uncharacterized protein n=1 Tax=gut metagenome TaxID=749906 RepID=J9H6T5_9ZZZZ